jgi:hypothetical protein
MSIASTSQEYGLSLGTPAIQSAGPITFGPAGILFLADSDSAAIFALGLVARPARPQPIDVEGLDGRLASFLGCARDDVHIRDMAVHPESQEVYLSVMRGSGADAIPVLLKVAAGGTIEDVPLRDIPFARASIDDAPAEDDPRQEVRVGMMADPNDGEIMEPRPGFRLRIVRDPLRKVTVTDLAYVDGELLVAGASNEEFASTLRRIPFPFQQQAAASSLEIYHVSHGRYETASPIRTFVPFGGNTAVLASYTCTPVVHFSLQDLGRGKQVKGRTVAELGAGNTPLDMVAYRNNGAEYLLVSNSRHPLMKLACKNIPGQEALTEPREPVGVPRETLPHPGVSHMANLGDGHVVMLQREDSGLNLRSYSCAAL